MVIVILALLLFGVKKVTELMKGLGTGLREFKKAAQGDDYEEKKINEHYKYKEEKKDTTL
ncbi:MAG: twin-arginine translocase TatA/TatE family subunit [Candidatus Walczuchella monophlebidarum]